jgi:tRNA G10  N-methylase Trm11
MKPYYEDEHVTIFCADWHDVAAELKGLPIDAVVTDPPYGIEADRAQAARADIKAGSSHKSTWTSNDRLGHRRADRRGLSTAPQTQQAAYLLGR